MAKNSKVNENASDNPATEEVQTEAVTNGAAPATNGVTATKRQAKASVTYVMPDGSEKNFPNENAGIIRIETTGGTKRDFDVSALSPSVKACAVLQGVVTRFQRGYQALKVEDEVIASIDDTIADLNNGIWIEVGTGEPRVTNLITAITMALEAEGTHERLVDGKVTADHRKDIGEKLASDENLRKEMRERPVIAANLAKLASEAAQKRAAEAAEKATAAASTGEASAALPF